MTSAKKASAAKPAVTIYHNPKCSTSRNTLAAIREAGIEPEVIEYLKSPPGRTRLVQIMKEAGLSPRDLIRSKEKVFAELGLDKPGVSDAALVEAMVEHPILMNRPIVVTPKGVRLCRPAERWKEIL
jgi:arsenate reductase